LIQFHEIMAEFGRVIPWLDGMDDMRFATNGEWFSNELLRRLGQSGSRITPYQFVNPDDARSFVGGILRFDMSPERLRDSRNAEIAECLSSSGSSFISCLQVRNPRRRNSVGTDMMRRSLDTILAHHGAVWGVVSNPRLLSWYASLGAELLSPRDNKDDLWIVHWNAT